MQSQCYVQRLTAVSGICASTLAAGESGQCTTAYDLHHRQPWLHTIKPCRSEHSLGVLMAGFIFISVGALQGQPLKASGMSGERQGTFPLEQVPV